MVELMHLGIITSFGLTVVFTMTSIVFLRGLKQFNKNFFVGLFIFTMISIFLTLVYIFKLAIIHVNHLNPEIDYLKSIYGA